VAKDVILKLYSPLLAYADDENRLALLIAQASSSPSVPLSASLRSLPPPLEPIEPLRSCWTPPAPPQSSVDEAAVALRNCAYQAWSAGESNALHGKMLDKFKAAQLDVIDPLGVELGPLDGLPVDLKR
jgi:hypothetical protein